MPAIGGDQELGPGLHHVGYVVPRMAAGIRRFEEAGGEVVIGPTDDPGLGVSCVLIRLPEGVDIELVAPLPDSESPITARLQRGGGLDHLCFWVDDLDASLARELENDAMLLVPPTHALTFDTTIAFVQRRGGLVVELMSTKR
ncbi:VOC family protein [Nocardioides marmoriginsengisoli]|uniref:VOC family protein n=1 Tax=Nocardioides marmoriginsengisoli TaxID=661483 RepID=A0A3N0CII2_9ACTN|nr:VOC family protein [Nocardioides marmoriginsengisoli]RNL63250.1 VOC family protein [Nocardioides marmoriginsengisoli]